MQTLQAAPTEILPFLQQLTVPEIGLPLVLVSVVASWIGMFSREFSRVGVLYHRSPPPLCGFSSAMC